MAVEQKDIKKGSIVRLKNGDIVKIENINVSLMPTAQISYKGFMKDGTEINVNLNDVIEVLSLLQKIWLIIEGWFKKAEVKKITSDEKNTTTQ